MSISKENIKNNYLISIIIPIYNGEHNIPVFFKSLLNQTIGFNNLEIILIDDVSTDKSKLMIDDLKNKYDNIVALQCENNSGFAGAPRNLGLKSASADWIMFLDQDDSYYDNACELLYKQAKNNQYDCVSGYYSIQDKNTLNKITKTFKDVKEFTIQTIDEDPTALKFHAGFWAKIYKRETIIKNDIHFIEDSPVEDMVFFEEFMLVMNGFSYIKAPIVRYLRRDNENKSLTYQVDISNMKAVGRGYEEMKEIFEKHEKTDYLRYAFYTKGIFYTNILLNGEFDSLETTIECLKSLKLIYEMTLKYQLYENNGIVKILAKLIVNGDFQKAAFYLLSVQPLKQNIKKLKEETAKLKKENTALIKMQKKINHSKIIRIIGKLKGWKINE